MDAQGTYMPRWYDEECHDTRRCLQREVTQGIYTHKQARATFQCCAKKKKRLYLAKFGDPPFLLHKIQEMPLISYNLGRPRIMIDCLGSTSSMLVKFCSHCQHTSLIELCKGFLTRWTEHTIVAILEWTPHDAKQLQDNHDWPLLG